MYRDDSLGISITVPEGAVPEFTIFPIEIGTCLYGPFQFAEGSTLISPILMLCPQKNIPLKKPITVTLPHLLTEATKSDIESFNIRVVKADHESLLFFDFDVKKCLFEDINLCESRISFDNRNSITFSVSHFCFLSVLGDLKMNAQKIGYCVYPLIRRDMNVISYRLCVTFLMAPFIKVRCVHVSVALVVNGLAQNSKMLNCMHVYTCNVYVWLKCLLSSQTFAVHSVGICKAIFKTWI